MVVLLLVVWAVVEGGERSWKALADAIFLWHTDRTKKWVCKWSVVSPTWFQKTFSNSTELGEGGLRAVRTVPRSAADKSKNEANEGLGEEEEEEEGEEVVDMNPGVDSRHELGMSRPENSDKKGSPPAEACEMRGGWPLKCTERKADSTLEVLSTLSEADGKLEVLSRPT